MELTMNKIENEAKNHDKTNKNRLSHSTKSDFDTKSKTKPKPTPNLQSKPSYETQYED